MQKFNTLIESYLLEKKKVPMIVYHYISPTALESVQQYGLLTPYGAREAGLTELYHDMLSKYLDRADGDVETYLKELRGKDWDRYLYVFETPIPNDATKEFVDFKNRKICLELSIIPDGKPYRYKGKLTDDDWKSPAGEFLFSNIPHIGIPIKDGVVPFENIKILDGDNKNEKV